MFSTSLLHTFLKPNIRVSAIIAAIVMLGACSPALSNNTAATPAKTVADCIEDRAALLALDQQAFDQDLHGGWRAISNKDDCKEEAADLIRDYRNSANATGTMFTLFWHEAQVRADIEQTATAIRLFKKSYKADDDAWNFYADATVAFLEQDHEALLAARAALISLPKPHNWVENGEIFGGKYIMQKQWPMNINVVDGLLKCFDKSYFEAYHHCTEPIKMTKNPLYHGD